MIDDTTLRAIMRRGPRAHSTHAGRVDALRRVRPRGRGRVRLATKTRQRATTGKWRASACRDVRGHGGHPTRRPVQSARSNPLDALARVIPRTPMLGLAGAGAKKAGASARTDATRRGGSRGHGTQTRPAYRSVQADFLTPRYPSRMSFGISGGGGENSTTPAPKPLASKRLEHDT